jgi:methyl-accepting chemotaxis protein
MTFDKLSIKQKLILGFFLITLISIIYSMIILLSSYSVENNIHKEDTAYSHIEIAKEIELINTQITLVAMDSIIDKGEGDISSERINELNKLFNKYNSLSQKFVSMGSIYNQTSIINKIDSDIKAMEPLIKDTLRGLIKNSANESEFAKFDDEFDRLSSHIIDDLESIIAIVHKRVTHLEKESMSKLNSNIIISEIAIVLIIVLSLVIGSIIYNAIRATIRENISYAIEGVEQILEGTEHIKRSSINLSEVSSSQAASTEEVNASLESSLSIISDNTENIRNATDISSSTNQSAQDGYEHLKVLSESMEGISESSQQISNIIKTIDEIAFQTNLLALNAAVEAARAGEHGLGFAVVAEEVRSLAGRSATSARETTDIISASLTEIANGNKMTQDTQTAFKGILELIEQNETLLRSIADSSNEQQSSVTQIHQAIKNIDTATQTVAANSEELASSSEELNAQCQLIVDNLQELTR